MKVAHVAVYLDAEQAKLIRWDAQEAVLAADEDLELTQKLHDVNAPRSRSDQRKAGHLPGDRR